MEKTEKQKKKMPKGAKIAIIIVSIVLVIAILAAVVVGAIVGISALAGAGWLIYKSKELKREFFDPRLGEFEVTHVVDFTFDGYGTVTVELYGKEAPKTVEHFLDLIEENRIGGKTAIPLTGNYIELYNDEKFLAEEFFDNRVANRVMHVEGVLTAERTNDNSGGTTFKILASEQLENDGKSAAFGRVVGDGLDTIQKIMTDYRKSFTGTITDSELKYGKNEYVITQDGIDNGYKFTAPTDGAFSFACRYPCLDKNGVQIKDNDGRLLFYRASLTITDEEGNEMDADSAVLKSGEHCTVSFALKRIEPNTVAEFEIEKTAPNIIEINVRKN